MSALTAKIKVHQRNLASSNEVGFIGPESLVMKNVLIQAKRSDTEVNQQPVEILASDEKGDLVVAKVLAPNDEIIWNLQDHEALGGQSFLISVAQGGDGLRFIYSMLMLSFLLLFGFSAKAQPYCVPSSSWCAVLQRPVTSSGFLKNPIQSPLIVTNNGNPAILRLTTGSGDGATISFEDDNVAEWQLQVNSSFWTLVNAAEDTAVAFSSELNAFFGGDLNVDNGSIFVGESFAFATDPDTEIYLATAGVMAFATDGVDRLTIDDNGNLIFANGLTFGSDNSISAVDGLTANTISTSELSVSTVNMGNISISPSTVFRKPNPQTSTGTALADDNALQFPVAAGDSYIYEIVAYVTGATADGIKVSVNGPSGTTQIWQAKIYKSNTLSASAIETAFDTTTSVAATDAETVVHINGTIAVGATPGTLAFRWAKNTDATTDTTVVAGSWIRWSRSF